MHGLSFDGRSVSAQSRMMEQVARMPSNEWRLRKMQRMERQGPRSLGPGFICVDVYTVVSGKGGEIRGRSPMRRRGLRRPQETVAVPRSGDGNCGTGPVLLLANLFI
ncbi:hypothetical protein J6590_029403 [Homalodisca vitripennis]|nr:hypothetical protein J6590_029403 [Homalodisca vitripennis]